MFQNTLVAYDGSKESQRALDSAISLARCLQAQLKIVTVVEALPGYTNMAALVTSNLPRDLLDLRCAKLQELQAAAQQQAAAQGITAELILIHGAEVDSIVEVARRNHTDLLVFGLRKHSGVPLFGSTSHQMTKRSPCTLLAVT